LGSTAVVCLAARSLALPLSAPSTWMRWDSLAFMSIASNGYQFAANSQFFHGHVFPWRGNTQSFPLYPYIVRWISFSSADQPMTAMIAAAVFHLAALCVLWNGWLKRQARSRALLLMWLAAVFPGMIYCHAVSSVSLFVFLSLLILYLMMREKFAWACLFGSLAGATHAAGLFFVPALGFWVFAKRKHWPGRLLKAWGACASPLAGALAVLVTQHAQTGRWDSAVRLLAYHRFIPGWSWMRLQQTLYLPPLYGQTALTLPAVFLQSSLVAVICLLAFLRFAQSDTAPAAARSRFNREGQPLILAFILVFWIAPHFSGYWHSFYRNETFLLPALTLLDRVLPIVLMLLALVLTVTAYVMAQQFFLSILV